MYRINTPQLTAARGLVRCGNCLGVFNALDALADQIKELSSSVTRQPELPADAAIPDTSYLQEPVAHWTDEDQPAETSSTSPAWQYADEEAAEISPPAASESWHASSDQAVTDEVSPPWQHTAEEFADAEAVAHEEPSGTAEETVSVHVHQEEAPVDASLGMKSIEVPEEYHIHATRTDKDDIHEVAHQEAVEIHDVDALRAEVHPSVTPSSAILPDATSGYKPELKAPPPLDLLEEPARFHWLGTAAMSLVCLALLGLLGLQYIYFNRNQLASYPELRPLLTRMCEAAKCEIPLKRDVAKISLMDRLVHSHPLHRDALQVNATLVNEAGFAQPYPEVELRFTDTAGKVVAGRRFQPFEYLKPGVSIKAGMKPRVPVNLTLEVLDPGNNAIGFEFSLR